MHFRSWGSNRDPRVVICAAIIHHVGHELHHHARHLLHDLHRLHICAHSAHISIDDYGGCRYVPAALSVHVSGQQSKLVNFTWQGPVVRENSIVQIRSSYAQLLGRRKHRHWIRGFVEVPPRLFHQCTDLCFYRRFLPRTHLRCTWQRRDKIRGQFFRWLSQASPIERQQLIHNDIEFHLQRQVFFLQAGPFCCSEIGNEGPIVLHRTALHALSRCIPVQV